MVNTADAETEARVLMVRDYVDRFERIRGVDGKEVASEFEREGRDVAVTLDLGPYETRALELQPKQ